MRIELYAGGARVRTIAAAAGKGSYLWRIPATLAPTATCTVRVRGAKYPNCFDFGNKAFTIAK